MATLAELPASPGGWRVWWIAARPRTLALGAAPVLVGSALAAAHGSARPLPAFAALVGALLIQIGTNLTNDVLDAEKGADTNARLGPARATQRGWLRPAQVKTAAAGVFGAAVGVGLYLASVGGWPIVAVGLVSIAAGVAYTAGPFPLGYHGLGDLAVFLFFGFVAVGGTYYVQALALPPVVALAAFPVGALATAVLVVNNVRDVDTDRAAGKRTLAVRWGRRAGRYEYAALLAVSYAIPLFLWTGRDFGAAVLLPLLTLPEAARLTRMVATWEDGPTLNEALAGTARLALIHAVLFAIGLWV